MKLDEWPPAIEIIFQRSGRDWTPGERNKVIESLFDKGRLRKLLTITRQHLGPPPPSPEDTENALYDFCESKSEFGYLDKLINNYDPKQGRFLAYFMVALKHCLHRQGAEIRERFGQEVSLVSAQHNREEGLDKDSESIELIPDHNLNSRPDLLSECDEVINGINQLPEVEKKVFIAYYIESRSYTDIATEMNITEANARQRCHRAQVRVRNCLEPYL